MNLNKNQEYLMNLAFESGNILTFSEKLIEKTKEAIKVAIQFDMPLVISSDIEKIIKFLFEKIDETYPNEKTDKILHGNGEDKK